MGQTGALFTYKLKGGTKEKMNKQNKNGITLIALIITIIVMLILIGVTVTVAINGGLFNTTKEAARETENAKIFEQIQVAVVNAYKVNQNDFTSEFIQLTEKENSQYKLNQYNGWVKILKGEFDKEEDNEIDIIGAWATRMGYSKEYFEEVGYTEEILIEVYKLENGIEEDTEVTKTQVLNYLKENIKEEIKENIIHGTAILDRTKLLEELKNIKGIDRVKEIGEEIKEVNGEYEISQEWRLIAEYNTKIVTITGKGEIIGQEDRITQASEDPKPRDITDGGKRTGTLENPYIIASIEDLVEFSNSVNTGNTYDGKYIELALDLDFKDSKSYKDAKSKDFGDLNGDGEVKGIQEELIDENGEGFTPIGIFTREREYSFNGNFNGDYHKIKNIYINEKRR